MGAPFLADPHLVDLPGSHVDAVADAVRRPSSPLLRVRDGQLAAEYDVRRQAGVRVRRVVCTVHGLARGGGEGRMSVSVVLFFFSFIHSTLFFPF